MTPEPDSSRTGLHVLAKTDELLELLVRGGDRTIAQLAEDSGEPRSSVYRLVATLEDLGFVTEGRSAGTYRLGLELYRLGSRVASQLPIRALALKAMERVFGQTGETVFLFVRHRDRAVCIERMDGMRVRSMAAEVGESLPLHLGAGPLALLAFAEPVDIERLLARPLERMTPQSIDDPSVIEDRLREVRERGYAVSDEDLVPGIAAVGVPIHDAAGSVVAALSLSGARPAVLGENISLHVDLLREAAGSLEIGAGVV